MHSCMAAQSSEPCHCVCPCLPCTTLMVTHQASLYQQGLNYTCFMEKSLGQPGLSPSLHLVNQQQGSEARTLLPRTVLGPPDPGVDSLLSLLCPLTLVHLELHAGPCPSVTFSLCPHPVPLSTLAHSASLSGPLCLNQRRAGQACLLHPASLSICKQSCRRPDARTCSWAPSRAAGAAQPIAKLLQREKHRPGLQLLLCLPRQGQSLSAFPDATDAEGPERGQRNWGWGR